MSLITIFLFLSLTVNVSIASDCTPIRLDAPGGPLHEIPIMDQDGLPICDSHAAALAIDSARFYENGNRTLLPITSPITLAVRIAHRTGFQNIEGPQAETLLESVPRIGVCDHEHISKQLTQSPDTDFCSELHEYVSSLKTSVSGSASSSLASCGLKQASSDNLDPLKVLAKLTATEANADALKKKFDQMCGNTFYKPPIKFPVYNHQRAKPFTLGTDQQKERYDSLKKSIDTALGGSKPVPPIIRYCSNFLFDANAPVGIEPTKGNMANCLYSGRSNFQMRGNHASVIAGRELSKDGKTCMYLIRNSHGTSCNTYDKKWKCDKTKGGQPCPAGDVCGGQIWVDEAALLANLQDVIYVEAK
jgi:hypothetical protein